MLGQKRVVVVGGGFGGLNTARALKSANVEVVLLDKTNHHLFQPLLYQVASAAISPGEVAVPIREIVRSQDNTTVLMGDVIGVDTGHRRIILADQETINYDALVLAVGARHSYFGNDVWEPYAPGLKTVQDALKVREKIFLSFERAERLGDVPEATPYLTFIIIGGGPTGVEMAGAIAEIAHRTLFKNFRRIQPERAKIYLVEAAPHILPMYPPSLSVKARQALEQLGVVVLEGKKVTLVNAEGVQVDDYFYPCTNVIWAAGNQASPLLKQLGAPLDRQGRVHVAPDLSVPGRPEVFVIGDAAHVRGVDGKPLPGIAPVAIQQGKYVAKVLAGGLAPQERRPFVYVDKGSMATIGTGKAVVMVGKFQCSGFFAWLLWCFIHIVYLIGFRNRLTVMLKWVFFYLTGQRGARLIYSSLQIRG